MTAKIINCLTLLIGLITVNQSCKKVSINEPVIQTIDKTLKAGESFQFDLGNFGDEEGATISIEATHSAISSVERDINSGKIIYKYLPSTNFTGTDKVEIKSERGSDGASQNNKTIYTIINFTITN